MARSAKQQSLGLFLAGRPSARRILRSKPGWLSCLRKRPSWIWQVREFKEIAQLLLRHRFVSLTPKIPRNRQRIDSVAVPPLPLIARGMIFGVMDGAERHGELVADLQAQPPRLRVLKMMGVGRPPAADQPRLARHVAEMLLRPRALLRGWQVRFCLFWAGRHRLRPSQETQAHCRAWPRRWRGASIEPPEYGRCRSLA